MLCFKNYFYYLDSDLEQGLDSRPHTDSVPDKILGKHRDLNFVAVIDKNLEWHKAGVAVPDKSSEQHKAGVAVPDKSSEQHKAGVAVPDKSSEQHKAGAAVPDKSSEQHRAGTAPQKNKQDLKLYLHFDSVSAEILIFPAE